MVALATLALQSANKCFQIGNLENKIRHVILMLSGADICTQSFGIDPSFRIKLLKFSTIFKIQHITDPHL